MTNFHGDKAKKNQNGRIKKSEFFNSTLNIFFFQKLHELVLGLVRLNDAKGIDVAQPITVQKDSNDPPQKYSGN